jgi:hypothetical protein
MLREQFSESAAAYQDPIYGVNLRASEENLVSGEARLMQNCEFYGGIRIRRGCQRLFANGLGVGNPTRTYPILGGHKYYQGRDGAISYRLAAYNNVISTISNNGAETVLTTSRTPGLMTYFSTWSITDSVYVTNGADALAKFDGVTFTSNVHTIIPKTDVVPILDRLLAITINGIERTNARVDNAWSNNSSWATYRPQRPGLFTAIYPYTIYGQDTIYPGALAFQERAYYLITGTDFGDDVTSLSPSTGLNTKIEILDGTVGTASPRSVCAVPNVGIFWLTADCNVYWIPTNALVGRFVGDKLQSTVSTAGLESTYRAALDKAWMVYHNERLMLAIPWIHGHSKNTLIVGQFGMDR